MNCVALTMALDQVPPRHPDERLRTLNNFALTWVDNHSRDEINRPVRADRMNFFGLSRLFGKMDMAMHRKCFFYDPSLEHGGPNPASQDRKYMI